MPNGKTREPNLLRNEKFVLYGSPELHRALRSHVNRHDGTEIGKVVEVLHINPPGRRSPRLHRVSNMENSWLKQDADGNWVSTKQMSGSRRAWVKAGKWPRE
jgi:hypothetical protein